MVDADDPPAQLGHLGEPAAVVLGGRGDLARLVAGDRRAQVDAGPEARLEAVADREREGVALHARRQRHARPARPGRRANDSAAVPPCRRAAAREQGHGGRREDREGGEERGAAACAQAGPGGQVGSGGARTPLKAVSTRDAADLRRADGPARPPAPLAQSSRSPSRSSPSASTATTAKRSSRRTSTEAPSGRRTSTSQVGAVLRVALDGRRRPARDVGECRRPRPIGARAGRLRVAVVAARGGPPPRRSRPRRAPGPRSPPPASCVACAPPRSTHRVGSSQAGPHETDVRALRPPAAGARRRGRPRAGGRGPRRRPRPARPRAQWPAPGRPRPGRGPGPPG